MAKRSKKRKKGDNGIGGGLGTVAGGIVGNMLGQVLADGIEHYLSGSQKKKTVKRLTKLVRKATSLRKS